MKSVVNTLGNQRHDALLQWLNSPAQRARRVIDVTVASWWPEGLPEPGRKARARAHGAAHTRPYARASQPA